jgi:hypothetical protein
MWNLQLVGCVGSKYVPSRELCLRSLLSGNAYDQRCNLRKQLGGMDRLLEQLPQQDRRVAQSKWWAAQVAAAPHDFAGEAHRGP